MRIFITGATGVIGKRAVPMLVGLGHSVSAAVRSTEKGRAVEELGATPHIIDLFDVEAVRRAVADHDVVINLATHIPHSLMRAVLPGAWRENDRIRRDGSRILAEASLAAGVSRLIQESYALIYRDSGDRWVDESAPIVTSKYNRTIEDAEQSAAWFTNHGRVGVVLRFAGFYGPDSSQLPEMVRMVSRGWSPLPAPDGYFSSVSHDDAASAVVAALDVPAGVYNVTDDRPLTRREVVEALAAATGARPPKFAPAWTMRLMGSIGEMLSRSIRLSNRKLRSVSNWAPKYPSVREGFRATLARN
jgi:nucleoside-diphosphate-sugar epimerase